MKYTAKTISVRISSSELEMERCQKIIDHERLAILEMGKYLIDNFSLFVNFHSDLYDDEFLNTVSSPFNVEDVRINAGNESVDVYAFFSGLINARKLKISIPFLYIDDDKKYALKRAIDIKTGGRKSMSEVNKIYNSQISDLMKKIEKLQNERDLVTGKGGVNDK